MELFGYTITKKEQSGKLEAFQIAGDSAVDVASFGSTGVMSYNFDLVTVPQGEVELIKTYRRISLSPDIDLALGEIKNEAFIFDVPGRRAFEPAFTTECDLSDQLKEKISEELGNIYNVIDFNNNGVDLFMDFYIDGRIYLHKVIDKSKPKEGIQKIIPIDPVKMKKVREIPPADNKGIYDITKIKEYYIFQDFIDSSTSTVSPTLSGTGLLISPDAIAYADSGLRDKDSNAVIGYLYKAIIPYNNLKLMEDSSIVLRVSRAPDRRAFYVDTGNLPKIKAEQYMKDLMNRFKSKMVYDSKTGSVVDRRSVLSMVEDYWLPRREGGRGTEIETLPGCLAMDTKVSLLDGRELSINEITNEMNNGKELWTYSCDPFTGKIKPGLISWAGVTQKSAKVIRLTLDNGESIVCTPDHKFPIYGRGFIRADELTDNSSIIPLYRRKKQINQNKRTDYEELFDNENKKWKFTHRVVNENIALEELLYDEDCVGGFNITHHRNFNRYDNSPNNLCRMSWNDHRKLHSDRGFDKEASERGRLAAKIKRETIRENNPEEYRRIYIKPMRDGLKNWLDNLSVDEITKRNLERSEIIKSYYSNLSNEEKIELGLKRSEIMRSYHSNLTDNEKQRRDEICNINLERAKIVNRALWNDPEFREKEKIRREKTFTEERREEISKRITLMHQKNNLDSEFCSKRRRAIQDNQKIIIDNEILCAIIDCVSGKTTHQVTIEDVVDLLNSNKSLVEKFKFLNKDKSTPNFNFDDGFTVGVVRKCPKDFGYNSWTELRRNANKHNHRIISIEWLDSPIEVGTLTIDNDYHTFALTAGIFTKNSDSIGVITDIEYFRGKLYQSLNVPASRFKDEPTSFSFGKSTEINRDEYRFKKFLNRVRQRFMYVFEDLLRTQLILKKIISPEDWDGIRRELQWNYTEDNAFVEYKETEIMMNRVEALQAIDQFVGKYYTEDWVLKNVMHYSADEIDNLEKYKNTAKETDQETEPEGETSSDAFNF